MAYDLEAIKQFGHNYVRLHQKVNPDRWYYHADRLGIAVAQDVVQHYGDSVQVRPTDFSARHRSFLLLCPRPVLTPSSCPIHDVGVMTLTCCS